MDFKQTVLLCLRKRLQMVREWATEEGAWLVFVNSRQGGGHLRHNLGAMASRDETAEKMEEEEKEKEMKNTQIKW